MKKGENSMENATKSVPAFGMKDKLGYMFGDFGNDFTFILSSSFMLKFYTDVMGVAPGGRGYGCYDGADRRPLQADEGWKV